MKYLLLSIIILFFNNCTTPKINQEKNKLSISYKEVTLVEGKGKELYFNTIHFPHINIYQYIYSINNNYITYEYIQLTDGYKFSKGVKRSIGIIFDTNAYNLEYQKGNLYFFSLRQNNTITYLIVENCNSSAYKLLYGLSKESYNKIKSSVAQDRPVTIIQSKTKEANQKNIVKYIKTKWSPKLIIMDQLISRPAGKVPHGRR